MKGVNLDNGFTAPQLKPRFYLFQRVRDQLYLTPPTLEEHTSSTGAYFGVLGFTKPLEKLVLCTVPLQSLLDWLSKPKGPYLVEASVAAAPDKALVYKPHYISTEPFCAAYMHLHVWHAAGSSVESEDKLNSSCLIFVNISKMSDVIPVVTQHPILLDVATKHTMMRTGEPMAPLSFRGFRLHTVWTRQSGGDLVRQVTFPRFLGETTASMLEYEPEKFSQGLMQGPKMVINLRPPSGNHWNITLDLILPLAVDMFRRWHEAKCAAQGLGGESEGAKVSPKEVPAPGESPQVVAGSSRAALPTETTHQGERTLETARKILEHIHAICLQTMHEMGGHERVGTDPSLHTHG